MRLSPAQLGAYEKSAQSAQRRAKSAEGAPAEGAQPGGKPAVLGPTVQDLLPDVAPGGVRGVVGKGGASRSVVVDLSPEATAAITQHMLETEVGKKIAAAFDAAGVDLSQAAGKDWSVDATAQRIVDFSTGLFGTFRDQHADLSDEEALDLFEETLRGAVDKGYGEALEVLQGMQVSDDVLDRAEQTIGRVHTLFDDFFKAQREALAQSAEGSEAAGDASAG